jgi:hypothetical protein
MMRFLLPLAVVFGAVSLLPAPSQGYGLGDLLCGSKSSCGCGCETGCSCEPGCGCGCGVEVGCGCATESACGCATEAACGCDDGCGGCCSANGRQYAGQKWTSCECCPPPYCPCVEPDGSCRKDCAQTLVSGCCCGDSGCGGGCCAPACGDGCCEAACGCTTGCGSCCDGCCNDGGGTLWFKRCGFGRACWELLDVAHSVCQCGCNGNGNCCSTGCGDACGTGCGACCSNGCGGEGCGGCSSELYWSEWHNDPPRCCDPCDRHGNWTGPGPGYYRAPYSHPYSPEVEVYAKGKQSTGAKIVRSNSAATMRAPVARKPKITPPAYQR